MLYNHILFHSGFYEIEEDEVEFLKYKKRLYWLQYALASYEYDLDRCVDYLYVVSNMLVWVIK